MRATPYISPVRIICWLVIVLSSMSCAQSMYYSQAAIGQARLIFAQRPVADIEAQNTPLLAANMAKVAQILGFAEKHIGLPVGGRYKKYVQVQGDFVLWNVVAADEFSVEPEQWCFPIAGCVSYKGYFTRLKAQKFAETLRHRNMDVYVGGVPAYSTLGWFNDPLLSTYLHWPEPNLAGLLFHELAHSKLYVSGDSSYSEAFATFVEQEGVREYLALHAKTDELRLWETRQAQTAHFNAYLLDWKNELKSLYAQNIPEFAKRMLKARLMNEIKRCYQSHSGQFGKNAYDAYFSVPVNNARLVSLAAYNEKIEAFAELFRQAVDWPEFFALAQSIASLPQAQRNERITALLDQASTPRQNLGEKIIADAGNRQGTNNIQCNTFTYHSFYGDTAGTKNNSIRRGGDG